MEKKGEKKMQYTLYDNKVFKGSGEKMFYSISNPKQFISKKEFSIFEKPGWDWEGTFGEYVSQNDIQVLAHLNHIVVCADPLDLITFENFGDWAVGVKIPNDIWAIQEFRTVDKIYNHTNFNPHLAVNLAIIPLLNILRESNPEMGENVNIYDVEEYCLYHKEGNAYHPVFIKLIEKEKGE